MSEQPSTPVPRPALAARYRATRARTERLCAPLEPDDYVFPAGHRVGLVIVSTDKNFTLRPQPGTQLTIQPDKSQVTLPLVGGHL